MTALAIKQALEPDLFQEDFAAHAAESPGRRSRLARQAARRGDGRVCVHRRADAPGRGVEIHRSLRVHRRDARACGSHSRAGEHGRGVCRNPRHAAGVRRRLSSCRPWFGERCRDRRSQHDRFEHARLGERSSRPSGVGSRAAARRGIACAHAQRRSDTRARAQRGAASRFRQSAPARRFRQPQPCPDRDRRGRRPCASWNRIRAKARIRRSPISAWSSS